MTKDNDANFVNFSNKKKQKNDNIQWFSFMFAGWKSDKLPKKCFV